MSSFSSTSLPVVGSSRPSRASAKRAQAYIQAKVAQFEREKKDNQTTANGPNNDQVDAPAGAAPNNSHTKTAQQDPAAAAVMSSQALGESLNPFGADSASRPNGNSSAPTSSNSSTSPSLPPPSSKPHHSRRRSADFQPPSEGEEEDDPSTLDLEEAVNGANPVSARAEQDEEMRMLALEAEMSVEELRAKYSQPPPENDPATNPAPMPPPSDDEDDEDDDVMDEDDDESLPSHSHRAPVPSPPTTSSHTSRSSRIASMRARALDQSIKDDALSVEELRIRYGYAAPDDEAEEEAADANTNVKAEAASDSEVGESAEEEDEDEDEEAERRRARKKAEKKQRKKQKKEQRKREKEEKKRKRKEMERNQMEEDEEEDDDDDEEDEDDASYVFGEEGDEDDDDDDEEYDAAMAGVEGAVSDFTVSLYPPPKSSRVGERYQCTTLPDLLTPEQQTLERKELQERGGHPLEGQPFQPTYTPLVESAEAHTARMNELKEKQRRAQLLAEALEKQRRELEEARQARERERQRQAREEEREKELAEKARAKELRRQKEAEAAEKERHHHHRHHHHEAAAKKRKREEVEEGRDMLVSGIGIGSEAWKRFQRQTEAQFMAMQQVAARASMHLLPPALLHGYVLRSFPSSTSSSSSPSNTTFHASYVNLLNTSSQESFLGVVFSREEVTRFFDVQRKKLAHHSKSPSSSSASSASASNGFRAFLEKKFSSESATFPRALIPSAETDADDDVGEEKKEDSAAATAASATASMRLPPPPPSVPSPVLPPSEVLSNVLHSSLPLAQGRALALRLKMKVVFVGCELMSLSAARELTNYGFEVCILEASEASVAGGSGTETDADQTVYVKSHLSPLGLAANELGLTIQPASTDPAALSSSSSSSVSSFTIEGGLSRLLRALTSSSKVSIYNNEALASIDHSSSGVQVHSAPGRTIEAEYVVLDPSRLSQQSASSRSHSHSKSANFNPPIPSGFNKIATEGKLCHVRSPAPSDAISTNVDALDHYRILFASPSLSSSSFSSMEEAFSLGIRIARRIFTLFIHRFLVRNESPRLIPPSTSSATPSNVPCVLCRHAPQLYSNDDSSSISHLQQELGPMEGPYPFGDDDSNMHVAGVEFFIHRSCATFSSEVLRLETMAGGHEQQQQISSRSASAAAASQKQNGQAHPPSSMTSTIMFNLQRAVKRARFVTCTGCGEIGASISCHASSCSAVYHLPCALQSQWSFISRPDQSSFFFCPLHTTKNAPRRIHVRCQPVINHQQRSMIATAEMNSAPASAGRQVGMGMGMGMGGGMHGSFYPAPSMPFQPTATGATSSTYDSYGGRWG